jgi:hypothetical protein
MQGYLWIIWIKLAGALWIIGGKLGSSLIFYFVAIDDPRKMQAETYTRLGHRVPQRVTIVIFIIDTDISSDGIH